MSSRSYRVLGKANPDTLKAGLDFLTKEWQYFMEGNGATYTDGIMIALHFLATQTKEACDRNLSSKKQEILTKEAVSQTLRKELGLK